jgi:hypothetical protein
MNTRVIAAEIVRRLASVLPQRVRLELSEDGSTLGLHAQDGWWGDVWLGLDDSMDMQEIADRVEIALSGVQDTVAHVINGAWPDLEDHELPMPWARVRPDGIEFGFGRRLRLEPIHWPPP